MNVWKLTWRSIRSFFGRYIALLLIVMLSVGFFSGLKISTDAMINTCEQYLTEQHFYDYRLLSTLGFSQGDVDSISEWSQASAAEGGKTIDAMLEFEENAEPFKLISLPEQVNLPSLDAGRMPAADNECLADAAVFSENDIGTVIRLTDENTETVREQLSGTEYTIVGIVHSPLYLNDDRGATDIGSGALKGFLYLPAESFTSDIYTEVNLTLTESAAIYSDEYETLISEKKGEITDICVSLAQKKYESLLTGMELSPETASRADIPEPEIYVLTRTENTGYVSFENDTSIIGGVANIFPVFFILIAMLVCITTMTRMVDEERTQIGVLKAMGVRDAAIMAKYLLYAGSATLIGWAAGFFLCTWGMPQIFWIAYSSLYNFASLSYLFSLSLALLTLAVALVGILGSTWISCRKELGSDPAKLIRPRTARKGKRILLERITPLWSRLSFLQKVTLRNMFRYKRRLIMMLVGISCCAGLVVTAFGVRDSMVNIRTQQFTDVQKYDMEAAFSGDEETLITELADLDGIDGYLTCSKHRVDLCTAEAMGSVNLYSFKDISHISDFWGFYIGGESISFPQDGQALISSGIARKLSLAVGDSVTIQDVDMQSLTVTVGGLFDNYIDNFVVISAATQSDTLGKWAENTALISVDEDTQDLAEVLTQVETVSSVIQLSATEESVNSALSCLNYIIWLIVLFSGVLAFIVIFNLTNINLAERSREIATVEVLGFYEKETESYTLRENLWLSVLASFIGLPLGTLFHRIVMGMIVIDNLSFNVHVTVVSYMLALVCTVLFAVIVNIFMKRQIQKIQMAESLKAVE